METKKSTANLALLATIAKAVTREVTRSRVQMAGLVYVKLPQRKMKVAMLVKVDTPAHKAQLLLKCVPLALMLRPWQLNAQNALLVGTAQVALMSQKCVRMGGVL